MPKNTLTPARRRRLIEHIETTCRGVDKHHDHLRASTIVTPAMAVAVVLLQSVNAILRLEVERLQTMP